MTRWLAVLTSLTLAACAPSSPDAPPSETPAGSAASDGAATPQPVAAPESLEGEYRVAGIDGNPVNLPHAMTVSISAERIRYDSHCVNATWNYAYSAGTIATEPVTGEAVCDRGRYPEEDAIEAAFAAVSSVRRTPANGIELSGGGSSVTLFGQ